MDHEDGGRNVVLCFDGTSAEPESGITNVGRLYAMLDNDPGQVTFYDPGVGTMGARSAITRWGRGATRIAGLVAGHGVRENVAEGYSFLMETYRPGDVLYVFGFSRGAYTARAFTGLLHTLGLLRPGAQNLVPYAMKLYAGQRKSKKAEDGRDPYWDKVRRFTGSFANPDFPSTFGTQVRFLGVWDTVKSVGALNARARFEQVRWPYTARIDNVEHARHAMASDERRRPFGVYRFLPKLAEEADADRYVEQWFRGAHGDVGGCDHEDHRLSDICLAWIANEAVAHGLRIDARRFERELGFPLGAEIPAELSHGITHPNDWYWALAGGWARRVPRDGDLFYPYAPAP